MSQTDEIGQLESQLAAVPTVNPYRACPLCPKCGHKDRITGLYLWSGGSTGFDWAFCPGARDEKTTIQVIPGLVSTEQRTVCFGVFVEHLHMRCRRCGFFFLMATVPARKEPFYG